MPLAVLAKADIVLEALQVLTPQFHEVRLLVLATANGDAGAGPHAFRSILPPPTAGCRKNPQSWQLWGVGGEGEGTGPPLMPCFSSQYRPSL